MASTTYKLERWSLEDLFPAIDSSKIQAAREELVGMIDEFEGVRDKLVPDLAEEEFVRILETYEQGIRRLYRLYGFGSLSFAADTQDQQVQILQAQMLQLTAEVENRSLFFKLWWKGLDDEAAERLMKAEGFNAEVKIVNDFSNPMQKGSSLALWVKTDSVAVLGGDAIGEIRKSSEAVAREAVSNLLPEVRVKATVDVHLADMLPQSLKKWQKPMQVKLHLLR